MRWMKANREHRCSACPEKIPAGSDYFGNSYSSFCAECGEKKMHGELVYETKTSSYIDIKEKAKCDFCDEPAEFYGKGHAMCQAHLGEVIEV